MNVEIDNHSGFCHGVTRAISKAEEELSADGTLSCLGDIVHNGQECARLQQLGLQTLTHEQLQDLHDAKVLLRAHGEPPETYDIAARNNIQIIDATCPVVLHLQKQIKAEYDADVEHQTQIVIFGKPGHAEVVGLVGQTEGHAIVIASLADAQQLDFGKHISLYSQTTMPLEEFQRIVEYIGSRTEHFTYHDTICRQVSRRARELQDFAQQHDVIIFVSGGKSSNGKALFQQCQKHNPRSYIVENAGQIDAAWLTGADSVGICGATSTPKWLMEQCQQKILQMAL